MTESHIDQIGILGVWAIGVGSALGGIFFGWQWVLYSGFWGALSSVAFVACFYWLYAGAITELASRYKTGGGSFDFVRFALGERRATVLAIVNLLKLVLANAATAMVISSYLGTGGYPAPFKFVIWFLVYVVFTTMDCVGINNSVKAQFVATAACISLIFFYGLSASSVFNAQNLYSSGYSETSFFSFLKGLPFALQFFDGFEEIPLLMNYTKNAERNIPRGIIMCYVSVTLISILVLVTSAGATSAKQLISSEAPLMDVIELVYGVGTPISDIFAYLICIGLLVNFFSFVVYSSQQLQFVAATGRLPFFLAYRNRESGAPVAASLVCSAIGLVLVVVFSLVLGETEAQNTLLVASMLPAMVGYVLTLECLTAVRSVERRIMDEVGPKEISAREQCILGEEPSKGMRFGLGTIGARVGQLQCFVVILGFVTLIAETANYFYGLIVIVVLGMTLYIIMARIMPVNLHRTEATGRSSIMDDPVAQMETNTIIGEYAALAGVPHYDTLFNESEASYLVADNPVLNEEGMDGIVNPLRKKRLSISQQAPLGHGRDTVSFSAPDVLSPIVEHHQVYENMYADGGEGQDPLETSLFLSENPILNSGVAKDGVGRRPSVAANTDIV